MKNGDDDECFKWCVTRTLNAVHDNPERITGSDMLKISNGEDIKELYKQFEFSNDMIFTEDDEKLFTEATICQISDKALEEDRVRDQSHLSGKFRGVAHNSCNINYKVPKFFPVYFHNLSEYDGHLLVNKLRNNTNEIIRCISNNEEQYISFSREVIVDEVTNKQGKQVIVKRELRFIDSFRLTPIQFRCFNQKPFQR